MKRRPQSLLIDSKKDWGRPNVPGTTDIPIHLAAALEIERLALRRRVSLANEKLTESSARNMESRMRYEKAKFGVVAYSVMRMVVIVAPIVGLWLTVLGVWMFLAFPETFLEIVKAVTVGKGSAVGVIVATLGSLAAYAGGRHQRQSKRKNANLTD